MQGFSDKAKVYCWLKNKEDIAGTISIKADITNKKLLDINLEIKEKFRRRNLSSILFYHSIVFAKLFFKLENDVSLELTDVSSVTEESGKPHYIRYGFEVKDKGKQLYEISLGAFLNNEENKERYKKKLDIDNIEGLYEININ